MQTQDKTKRLEGEERDRWQAVRSGIRRLVRGFLEDVIEEELTAALGADSYARADERRGYRNGHRERKLTTNAGPLELAVPRGRLFGPDGRTREWESTVVPRYKRRTPDVDAAVLGCYLSGVNTRKVKAALRPLLKGAPLSRSAVSRVVGRLQSRFDEWRGRSLTPTSAVYAYFDALNVRVRLGKRVHVVPVLAAVGVRATGEKELLHLELCGSEAVASWTEFVADLAARGLPAPVLAIVDGNPGLTRAIETTWPGTKIQRCTRHKLKNLLAKAPVRLREELATDYRAFVYAATAAKARAGYERFLAKWAKRCPGVAKSLEEAGERLLTFTAFPPSQWKALRTTNPIERLNEEFRRRVKTQGCFPAPDAVVVLLFGLVASGLVRMRKIDGWGDLREVLLANGRQAA